MRKHLITGNRLPLALNHFPVPALRLFQPGALNARISRPVEVGNEAA